MTGVPHGVSWRLGFGKRQQTRVDDVVRMKKMKKRKEKVVQTKFGGVVGLIDARHGWGMRLKMEKGAVAPGTWRELGHRQGAVE